MLVTRQISTLGQRVLICLHLTSCSSQAQGLMETLYSCHQCIAIDNSLKRCHSFSYERYLLITPNLCLLGQSRAGRAVKVAPRIDLAEAAWLYWPEIKESGRRRAQTDLPTKTDSSKANAWLSGPYEHARRPKNHSGAPAKGPEAAFRLIRIVPCFPWRLHAPSRAAQNTL